MLKTLYKLMYIINNTAKGGVNNPEIFEETYGIIEQINDVYNQCTMDEKTYIRTQFNDIDYFL